MILRSRHLKIARLIQYIPHIYCVYAARSHPAPPVRASNILPKVVCKYSDTFLLAVADNSSCGRSPHTYFTLLEDSQHPPTATIEQTAYGMNHHEPGDNLQVGIHAPSRYPKHPSNRKTNVLSLAAHFNQFDDPPEPLPRRTTAMTYRPTAHYTGFDGSPRPLSPTTTTARRPAVQYNEFGESPGPIPRRTTATTYKHADPRPPRAFRNLDGYWNIRNEHYLLDCFGDCKAKRRGERGVRRRANMLSHLRQYHGQDIQRGGW